jgi:mannose-1-phosphate guanylyltransferase
MNVVIMAGGGGTRLWPLSLQDIPKQFVDLGTGKPLIAHAYDRAVQVAQKDAVYVATSQKYRELVRAALPEVADSRIFLEPSRRDTTAAFVHVCLRLRAAGHRVRVTARDLGRE